MNKTDLLNSMLLHRDKTMPVLTFPAIELLHITVRDLISDAQKQADAMKILSDRYPMSASLSMMDLSVEAEAFGASVRFFEMDIPTITGTLLKTEGDIDQLMIPKVGTKRTKNYIEGIRLAKTFVTDRPVFAGCIGPFSLAGRLLDMTEIMVDCYIEPEMVHKLLEKTTTFLISYILEFKRAGADGIILAEPAAGLLSPDLCSEFSSVYVKKIADAVKDDHFIFCYHNCGNTVPLFKSILDIDADIYHFGNAIDIEDQLKQFPSNKIVMGNLSPTEVFRKGTKESIHKAVFELLHRCNHYPNFILSSGCDIPPLTPIENIDAFFDAVRDFFSENR